MMDDTPILKLPLRADQCGIDDAAGHRLCEMLGGTFEANRRAAYMVELINAHADLVEQARQRDALLALLERAIDDQRHVETAQGMIEWFEEAVDLVAELKNLPRPRRGFKFSDEEALNVPQN